MTPADHQNADHRDADSQDAGDERWRAATRAQYNDDTNLAARQALFGFLVEAKPIPAPIGDFSVLAGKRVLDVGCGNGVFLKQADAAGAAVIGADLSPGMLAAAGQAVPTAPLLCVDAEHLPVGDDSVDVAMALWMLYHVDDRPAAVAELRRVVRSDGFTVATTNSGENRLLDDLVGPSLAQLTEKPVTRLVPPLGFTAENGADILGTAFDTVETSETGNVFHVTDPAVVVGYVGSLVEVIKTENGPFDTETLLTGVGRRASEMIDRTGHVELRQTGAVFICR